MKMSVDNRKDAKQILEDMILYDHNPRDLIIKVDGNEYKVSKEVILRAAPGIGKHFVDHPVHADSQYFISGHFDLVTKDFIRYCYGLDLESINLATFNDYTEEIVDLNNMALAFGADGLLELTADTIEKGLELLDAEDLLCIGFYLYKNYEQEHIGARIWDLVISKSAKTMEHVSQNANLWQSFSEEKDLRVAVISYLVRNEKSTAAPA